MGPLGPALALACRIVLALVLAVAAIAKIADRRALPGRLRAMGVSHRWDARLAVALPVAELAVALALVAAPRSELPATVAVALLAAFTVFLVATIRRAVPCPCFGTVRTARVADGPAAIVRNGLLLGMGVVATGSVGGARPGGTVLVAAVVASIAAAAVGVS
jgi:hypothetical protein